MNRQSYRPRGFTLGGHSVSEFDFILHWQTSSSIQQVKQNLGLPDDVSNGLLSQLAGRLRRDNGVPLKKFSGGGAAFTAEEYELLGDFAEWVYQKALEGVPQENLTYQAFLQDQ